MKNYSILNNTGLDVIVIDEHSQRGNSFGEKISSAFEDIFALGYESLVLVGNDSVGLTDKCVNQSFKVHFSVSKNSVSFLLRIGS